MRRPREELLWRSSLAGTAHKNLSRDIIARDRIELQTRCVTDIELIGLSRILKVPVDAMLGGRGRKH